MHGPADPDEEQAPHDPDEVVDDRIELHAHEQRRRAEEEPKHKGPPDRTIGTEPNSS